MALPPELETILTDFADPGRQTAELFERTRGILSNVIPNSANTAIKGGKGAGGPTKGGKRAAAVAAPGGLPANHAGPFAMRLLNLTNKSLASSASDSFAPADASMTSIIDVALSAVDVLVKLEKSLGMPPLSIVKALSTIMNRILELKLLSRADSVLQMLQRRLTKLLGGSEIEADLDEITSRLKSASLKSNSTKDGKSGKENVQRPRIPASRGGAGPKASATVASKADGSSRLVPPPKTTGQDLTALVLNYYVGLVRWRLASGLRKDISDLQSVAEAARVWCKYLTKLDSVAASKFYDTFFRLFFRAEGHADGSDLVVLELQEVALLFYLESPAFTAKTFHEMVVRASTKPFERTLSETGEVAEQIRSRLATFFRAMFQVAERLPRCLDYESFMIGWTDQFLYLLRRQDLSTESELVCARVLAAVQAELTRRPNPSLLLLGLSYEIDRYADCVENSELHSSLDLSLHETLLKDLTPLAGTPPPSESSCRRYSRATERFRRSATSALADAAKTTTSGSNDLQLKLNVLVALRSCAPVLEQLKGLKLASSIDFGPHLMEVYLFVSRLLVMLENDRNGAQQIDSRQLFKAKELADKHATGDQLMLMANVFYVQGTAAYKDSRFSDAAKAMKESCALVESALRTIATPDNFVTLAKRQEMLATCLYLDGQRQDGMTMLLEAARSLVRLVSQTSEGDKLPLADQTLDGIFERYCKWQLGNKEGTGKYSSFADNVLRGVQSPVSTELRQTLLRRELALLQASHPDFVEALLLVVDAILATFEDDASNVKMRANFLVMKARIARSSGVGYFSSAIDAVLAALDLLKNHGDEPEFRELLASTYALRASLWSDTEVFDHHSFRLAMRIWNQMLPEEPPLATRTAQTRPASGNGNDKVLGGKRPPVNVKRTGAKTTTKVPSKPTGLRLKQTEQNALPKSKLGASATLPVDPAKVADSTSSAFENIDQAFADARYAADVLGIQYHLADRIRMLRICLRMNSLRSDRVRVVAEAAALESLIGHSYLVLGYTGQSGLAYQRAKALVETHGTGDSLVDVRFYLGYSYYLSCIGNLDKSQNMYDRAAAIARESKLFDEVEGPAAKETAMRLRLAVSNALFVQTSFLFAQGNMAFALRRTIQAMRLLIETASKEARRRGFKVPVVTSLGISEDAALLQQVAKAQHETVLELLLCLENLGQMLLIRGSPGEAELYFRRGWELSKSISSTAFCEKFSLSLAETDYRRLRLDESEKRFQELATSEDLSDESTKDLASRHMRAGDLCFRRGDFEAAEARYEKARIILDMLASPTFLAALEKGEPVIAAMPIESAPSSGDRLPADRAKTVPDNKNAKGDTFLLSYVKTELLARLGSTIIRQGRLPEAEKRMTAGSLDESALDQAEYLVTYGILRLFKAMQSVSSSSFMDSFFDSAFSLPWFSSRHTPSETKPKPAKRGTKGVRTGSSGAGTGSSAALLAIINEAENVLEDAFAVCYSYGFPKLFQDACYGLVLLNMFQVYSVRSKADQERALWSALFYLHKRNGITAIRETQSLLLDRSDPTPERIALEWPETKPPLFPPEAKRLLKLQELYEAEITLKPSEFKAAYVDDLPTAWTVCSISIDEERDDIMFSRLRNGKEPVIVRLPLRRQASRDNGSEDCLGYKAALAEFQDILAGNDATLEQSASNMSRADRVQWWNTRKALDERLGSLLAGIDTTWLGAFKSLLLPEPPITAQGLEAFRDRVEATLKKALGAAARSQAVSLQVDRTFSDSLLRLGDDPDDNDVEDFLYFVLESFQAVGVSIDLGEIDMDLLTIDIKEIISQLYEHERLDDELPSEHLILVLDRSTQMFPWESLPSVRHLEISRTPSLMFLRDRLRLEEEWSNIGAQCRDLGGYVVDPTKTSYVLNPGGDLIKTQQRFEDLLDDQEWRGIVGREPESGEICDMLSSSDVFLYFGHNAGEQFIRGHEIRKLDRCAVALLMGCSSGKLKDLGEFEPTGTALHYMIAGCPTVVGNLWEVTDKDIDQFAMKMLSDWGVLKETRDVYAEDSGAIGPSIAACVAAARDECNLKYLNGAAPIIYGVPSFVKFS